MVGFFTKVAGILQPYRYGVLYKIWFFNAVFVLCAVTVTIINNISLKNMTVNEINISNRNFVSYIVDNIDNQLDEVRKLAYTYGKDSDVIQFSNSYALTGNDSITLKKILEKFIVVKATKNIIDDMFIYYKAQNMVLSSKGSFEADFFFNKYILNLKGQIPELDTGAGRLLILPRTELKRLGGDFDYRSFGIISYIYPVNRNSYLHIMVNEGEIRKNLYEATYDKNNIIVILDRNGKLISSNIDISRKGITPENLLNINGQISESNNNIVEIAGYKYILSSKISRVSGLKYFVIFPVENIQAKAAMVYKYTYLLILALLLLGVFMTAVLRKTIYIPVKSIMNLLNVGTGDKKERVNEFETIRHEIDSISRKNEKYMDTLQKQQPFVEEIFLNRLMCEMSFDNAGDIVEEMNLKYKDYVVIAMVISSYDTTALKTVRSAFETFLYAEFSFTKLYSHTNDNLYIIKTAGREDFAEVICKYANNNFKDGNDIMFGVSSIYTNILDIKKACKESKDALKNRSAVTQERVFIYNNTASGKFKMSGINHEEEIQLINNVFSGNSKNVLSYIEKFGSRNHDLPFRHLKNAYIYLSNLLLMTMNNKSIKYEDIFGGEENDLISEINECENTTGLKEILIKYYIGAADYCSSMSRENNDKMLDFVNNNFHKGICLEQLAEEMNMSPVYVSSYFKRVTGFNFLAYVNNLKLKKAKELLSGTNKSVTEIAEILGFSDSNSFIKLFKKLEGVTPGTYKKNA